MNRRFTTLVVMAALILFGLALRLYRINNVPLRGDEAFTVIHWMREPFSHTLAEIATRDPQPPLAYALYRLYALTVGSGEYQVRFLPVLLNLLGIAAMYGLGRRFGGRRLGLLAALLYAINPHEIWHAQDARGYAIWAALSPLALWLAVRALEKRRRVDWVLYILTAVGTLYVYYLELFVVFSLNLYVFITHRRDRQLLKQWFVSQVVTALAIMPWYLQPRLLVGSGYGGTGSGFDPILWLTDFIPTLTFGSIASQQLEQQPSWVQLFLIVVLVIALVAGGVILWKQQRRDAFLIGLLGTVPLLLLAIVSLKLNVFVPRYVLSVTPIYILLLAALLLYLWSQPSRRGWYRTAFFCSCVVLLAVNAENLISYYFYNDYAKAPDWRTLATYLEARTTSNDLILNTSADEAYTFYHDDYSVSADQIRMPANPDLSASEIARLLSDAQNRYDSLWVAAQTPPTWGNNGLAEAWLDTHMQPIRQTNVNGLRAYQYMSWEVAPINQPPLATFGDNVELADAEVLLPPEPTGELVILLYWRPISASPSPLKVFVHLLGDINPATDTPLWTQDDDYPQNGLLSTSDWTPSTLYRDVYTLPLDSVPEGDYTVAVGLYEPITQERIPVGADDTFIIRSISLSDYAN